MTYRNETLTAVCEMLEDEGLTFEDVRCLALDLAMEFEARADNRAEADWIEQQMTGGTSDAGYRRDMIAAGRGELLP